MIRQAVTALMQATALAPRTQWPVHPRLTPGGIDDCLGAGSRTQAGYALRDGGGQ